MGHERPTVKTFVSHRQNGRPERGYKTVYASLMAKVMKQKGRIKKALTQPVGQNLSFIVGEGKEFENPRQLAVKIIKHYPVMAEETLAKLIHRVMYQQENVEYKTLLLLSEGLGKIGFEVAPWQLLVPGCNPANPRILASVDPHEIELWKAIRRHAEEKSS